MENQNIPLDISKTAWDTQIARTNKLLSELTDEQLQNEVSPGRNSGIYLLGHLVAVHDGMIPLLGLGEKKYPELEEVFLKNGDKAGLPKPTAATLRQYWNEVNNALSAPINDMSGAQWLERHTAVSETDFAKEPHRNKMNILLSRTNHLAYHLGQMAFLKK